MTVSTVIPVPYLSSRGLFYNRKFVPGKEGEACFLYLCAPEGIYLLKPVVSWLAKLAGLPARFLFSSFLF